MSLLDQINQDLMNAMKKGDKNRTNVLRLLKSKIRNREIEKGEPLNEEEGIMVLNSAVKSAKESMELYQKGNRQDLYEKEANELEIIQSYLPKPLTKEELTQAIDGIIDELAASSAKDFGRVMKEVMSRYRGQVDGKQVQEMVRDRLS